MGVGYTGVLSGGREKVQKRASSGSRYGWDWWYSLGRLRRSRGVRYKRKRYRSDGRLCDNKEQTQRVGVGRVGTTLHADSRP